MKHPLDDLMNSPAPLAVTIQTSTESVPAVPSWFGEVILIGKHLQKRSVLTKINERVRFAR